MRKDINNQVRMLQSVVAVMNLNKEKWKKLTGLIAIMQTFTELNKDIEAILVDIPSSTKSITDDKKDTRAILEGETKEIAMALLSIANSEKNTQLQSIVNINDSKMAKLKEAELVTLCQGISAQAKKYTERLVQYDIKAERITLFESLTEDFNQLKGSPRLQIGARKATYLKLNETIKKAITLLHDQIDIQVEILKRSEPEFYSAYWSARTIVSLGVRHKKKDGNKKQKPDASDL
jgi:hypothetical protein